MPEPKLFYRLAEYMLDKYGPNYENWFWLVAKFVSFESKIETTADEVKNWCEGIDLDPFGLTRGDLSALKKLFGFKNNEDFFTDPAKMPQYLKEVAEVKK